jgi:hypothetical protein
MTPKEKALKLCDAFYQFLPLEQHVITTNGDLSWEYDGWKNAKQCALIAVDEILWEIIKYADNSREYVVENSLYWTEVKKEIEKS